VASLFTTEEKYHGAINTSTKTMWIQNILGELGFPEESTLIYYDNQSAIQVAENPISHSKMNYVDRWESHWYLYEAS